MFGLGLGSVIQLGMMAYNAYQMNQQVADAKAPDMTDVNAEIDGGKESETDEVTEEGKTEKPTDFLSLAGSKTKKESQKYSGLGGFSGSSYF